jgi:signal transduction histidine kinase
LPGIKRSSVAQRLALILALIIISTTAADLVVMRLLLEATFVEVSDQITASTLLALRAESACGLDKSALSLLNTAKEVDVAAYDASGKRTSRKRPLLPSSLGEVTRKDALRTPYKPTFIDDDERPGRPAILPAITSSSAQFIVAADRVAPRVLASDVVQALALAFLIATAIGLAAVVVVTVRIRRALFQATRAASRIADGVLNERLPTRSGDETSELAVDFNRMADTVQRLIDQLRVEQHKKRQMLDDWIQEIRAPANAILASLDPLTKDDLAQDAEKRKQVVDSAFSQAHGLKALVEDLTLLARIENEEILLELLTIDLGSIAKAEVDRLKPEADRAGVVLALDRPAAPNVSCDPLRLGHALRNILKNAIRHSPRGKTIRVVVDQQRDIALIEVIDEGPGIAAEHIDRLGERFYRVDKETSRSGLGLSIARSLIELHGGALHIDSEVGKGTTVTVALPGSGPAPFARPSLGP